MLGFNSSILNVVFARFVSSCSTTIFPAVKPVVAGAGISNAVEFVVVGKVPKPTASLAVKVMVAPETAPALTAERFVKWHTPLVRNTAIPLPAPKLHPPFGVAVIVAVPADALLPYWSSTLIEGWMTSVPPLPVGPAGSAEMSNCAGAPEPMTCVTESKLKLVAEIEMLIVPDFCNSTEADG